MCQTVDTFFSHKHIGLLRGCIPLLHMLILTIIAVNTSVTCMIIVFLFQREAIQLVSAAI